MKRASRFLMAAGVAAALGLAGCQQIALKDQVKALVAPQDAAAPWVTSYGDRSVSLTWAEPTTADMGAVEIVATPKYGTGVAPLQVVIPAGEQTATLNLPTNNAEYTITVFMVDKGGNVSSTGITTTSGRPLHYFVDLAGASPWGGWPLQLNVMASQLPIKSVVHFNGSGAGAYNGYDAYTYDSVTGLPGVITTYDASGAPTIKHEIQYATGGVNRVLDILSQYSGSGWALALYTNTYYDSSGLATKTELYQTSPHLQMRYSSAYNFDAAGKLAGWVTSDGAGNVTGNTTYIDLGTREQWARADAAGVVVQGGLIENDYDAAGRPSAFFEYNTKDMTIAFKFANEYDANGNLMKVTFYSGNPLQQQGYDIFSY